MGARLYQIGIVHHTTDQQFHCELCSQNFGSLSVPTGQGLEEKAGRIPIDQPAKTAQLDEDKGSAQQQENDTLEPLVLIWCG